MNAEHIYLNKLHDSYYPLNVNAEHIYLNKLEDNYHPLEIDILDEMIRIEKAQGHSKIRIHPMGQPGPGEQGQYNGGSY